MEIILHAHHADVTESLRAHAEAAIRRIAGRMHRVVTAIIRFISDGPTRRVEIVLNGTRSRSIFAQADAREFAPALASAVHRLESQVSRARTRQARRNVPPGERSG